MGDRQPSGGRTSHGAHGNHAAREQWSSHGLDQLQQDGRLAGRSLRRNPGIALTVNVTLALGVVIFLSA